jgi:hypothetical protein
VTRFNGTTLELRIASLVGKGAVERAGLVELIGVLPLRGSCWRGRR